MTDAAQILIIAAITIMTIVLSIVGVQLVLLLKDLRQTAQRVNRFGMELEKIGVGFSGGVAEVLGFVMSIKKVVKALDIAGQSKRKSR